VDLGLEEVKTGTAGDDDSLAMTSFDGVMDTVFTGAGDDNVDTAIVNGHSNVIFAGAGNDQVEANARDLITGGTGNDTLSATQLDGNRLDGGVGFDTINVGSSRNRIFGGIGDDIINVLDGAGTNYLNGGDGKDQFWLVRAAGDRPAAKQYIMDWTAGEDVIGLSGVGFASLSFEQAGSDTLLLVDQTAIAHFKNTSAAALNYSNNFAGLI
jgi:Ca2+-binding RTX toxin-like protein